MRALVILLVLFPFSLLADDLRIAVGMPTAKAVAIIKGNGGMDITPQLAVVGPKGEWPLHGIYWSFRDFKAVIAISGKEKIEGLTYWTDEDFGKSKSHRATTGKEITALKIDQTEKRISIEPMKNAGGAAR